MNDVVSGDSIVRTETWSVPGPHSQRSVSQETIESVMLSAQKKLSTLIQFLADIDYSVGVHLDHI
jgi:hypothetical protein